MNCGAFSGSLQHAVIRQSVTSALFLLVCGLHVFSGMQKCTKNCFTFLVQKNKATATKHEMLCFSGLGFVFCLVVLFLFSGGLFVCCFVVVFF